MKNYTTRFAPSPTGYLHLGHAYSALFAKAQGQKLILRIEDIDRGRCRSEFVEAIFEDLNWLGLDWQEPVRFQSKHFSEYQSALSDLQDKDLLYPCFCTRKDIQREIKMADRAPHGPDGVLYPGTCRAFSQTEQAERMAAHQPFALRLKMDQAIECAGPLTWIDLSAGEQRATPEIFGDVVLARKDVPTSYHLAVSLDDHLQGIDLVTRGEDLFHASHLHRLLQALLGYNVPTYHHHKLLVDDTGKRFAKRDRSLTLKSLRESGSTPEEIYRKIGV